jgi:hypothetical protein
MLTAAAVTAAAVTVAAAACIASPGTASHAATPTPVQVYGAWLCGTDECGWATVPDMTSFDTQNHWLIDRGAGQPSVNLVSLAFVNPLKLLNGTTDAGDAGGVPAGMTQAVVSYFTSHGVAVMLSIGGVTYTGDWDTALSQAPAQLGLNAAALAVRLGVGIEIDYENGTSPNLTALNAFISSYRSQIPYDASGANPAARLTIDLAVGNQYLTDLSRYAATNWLSTASPVLDYANAMVANRQLTVSNQEQGWLQHVDGMANYAPPVPPLAPAKFTGSVYLTGSKVQPECDNFASSLESATGSFVQTVAPAGAGTTPACWATCSGPPASRPRTGATRSRRTAARPASARALPPTASPSRCPRCARADASREIFMSGRARHPRMPRTAPGPRRRSAGLVTGGNYPFALEILVRRCWIPHDRCHRAQALALSGFHFCGVEYLVKIGKGGWRERAGWGSPCEMTSGLRSQNRNGAPP